MSSAFHRLTLSLFIALCLCAAAPLVAQEKVVVTGADAVDATAKAAPPVPVILERGQDHRVLQNVVNTTNEQGTVSSVTNTYTELATGLHYQDAKGEWHESKEEFQITPDGAVAQEGSLQVTLAPNINTPGAVTLITPDGKRLRSKPAFLSLRDTATGKSVMVAEVRDTMGELLAPNLVVYPACFSDFTGSITYQYNRAQFEQNVVIHDTGFGKPEDYGLDAKTSVLEMWTEFSEAPVPIIDQRAVPGAPDDQALDFGALKMGRGQAFTLINADDSIDVGKSWLTVEGRTYLVEVVNYPTVAPLLDKLPRQARNAAPAPNARRLAQVVNRRSELIAQLAPRKPAATPKQEARIRDRRAPAAAGKMSALATDRGALVAALAPLAADYHPASLVLDYTTISANQSGYTFRSDTTYYITAPVNLSGTTIIEGGTVIKFPNTGSPKLSITGSGAKVTCLATNYRPAILTAKDDDSAGEQISGSTGSPSGYYASTALYLDYTSSGVLSTLNNLHIRYANVGVNYFNGNTHVLSHAQFLSCATAIQPYFAGFAVRNALFHNCSSVVSGSGSSTFWGENITVDSATTLNNGGSATVYLTNSLLVAVTTLGTYSGANNFTASSAVGIFQTVGAGAHYLVADSTYRNAGTTNINATLLASLRKRTTYPPLTLLNAITTDTTLSPQAIRDMDTIDCGYHYDPLDYVVSDTLLTNAVLTLTNGVVVGVYGSSGLKLQTSGKINGEGTPLLPNRFVRYHAVQEQSSSSWAGGSSWTTLKDDLVNGTLPEIRLRFTEFPMLANGGAHFAGGSQMNVLALTDCRFYVGNLTWNVTGAGGRTLALTNNLFEYGAHTFGTGSDTFTLHARNNLFRTNTVYLYPVAGNSWSWNDNLFDNVTLTQNANTINNSNDGYVNTTPQINSSAGANNVTATTLNYQTWTLGVYYQTNTSPFLNTGSRLASAAGLYHYTTTTNQTKEAGTTVDIGLHYVAVNSSGQPVDTDSDGVPDYLEDRNGNGTFDSGETDWQTYNSPNSLTGNPGLLVFTPLK